MTPERFEIHVDDEEITDLRRRLAAARLPGDLDNDQWGYGTNETYLAGLLGSWEGDFDWRAQEAAMNAFDHYRATIGGQLVHYMHVARPGALPLLLLGGWPWTFWDFAEVAPQLSDFELVIPDLPGYGFSTPLTRPGTGFMDTAEMFHELMTQSLGHQRYGVYGSDWGGFVAAQLAHTHPEAVVGLHTTMPYPLSFAPVDPELWQPEEASRQQAAQAWAQHGLAYFQMHATRPQTVAYLTDSPAAVAGWIVEKIHAWSDHSGNPDTAYPRDKVLATLSIYWFTRSLGSSARFYAESLRRPWSPSREGSPVIGVPTAVAAYPKEPAATPKRWMEEYFDLQRYTVMERGGHFPAVEDPAGLSGELTKFFANLPAS
ncbi:MAG: epoxide hydrolase [Actinomycetota bacterium]|jgi:pimeloyl-ACP methyl ester carboxylesterase|nr:epoxide hydrolase [Actinomycetota bacterium]MDA8077279.1 epoxide hydrolase [Actinomycetota bacterium]